MNKSAGQTVSAYKFDDVTLDMTDFRVHKRGTAQKITPKAFEVLVYLIENSGRVVEKQELFTEIWREHFVTDNALTRVIREIRQVIGDEATAPRYIETVPKRGYRFIAEVETVTTATNGKVIEQNDELHKEAQNFVAPKFEEIEKPISEHAEKPKSFKLSFVFVPLGFLILISLLIWIFYPKQTVSEQPEIARNVQITNWAGLDNYPVISPDGNSIAYSSNHNGSFEIFVKSLTPGAREIQVTSDGGQNFQPSWSPDGANLAFYSRQRGGIWIVPASGGASRQLTDFGSRPAWSPDGKTIAFQSSTLTDLGSNNRSIPPSVLWLVPAAGGVPRQLTEPGKPNGGHGAPSWSPDGKKIAFNVEDVMDYGFWAIDIETGNFKKLVPYAFDPVFAPDGKSIFYSSLSALWKTDLSATGEISGEPSQILNSEAMPIRHLSLSADGKRLAYTRFRNKSGISSLALNAVTGNPLQTEIPLVENTSNRNTFPAFSPNGQKIAFVSYIPGKFATLNLMDIDGKNQTQTTFAALLPNWFPDNERIGSLSRPDDNLDFSAFNITNGKSVELLKLNDAEYVRLSPDGKEIAYNSKTGGTINLWTANLETGERKQLTFDKELMGFPAWSPDGKFIAFQVKRGDDTHIAIIPREGGTIEQLTSEPGQSWVYSFSPDGDKIAFAGQRDFIWNLFWVSRSTREQKKLTGNTKLNAFYRYPAWSPRGDQIVFESAETFGNIWMAELK